MRLLERFLSRTTRIRARPPDHVEERSGLFLLVWGDEGYWQVADREFRDFLQAAEQPASLGSILKQHPEWNQHRSAIEAQLGNMKKAGLLEAPRLPASPLRIENLTINLTTGCNLHCRTCYVPREVRTSERLDVSRLLPFLEELRPCFAPAATLSLLGGEPFLHAEGVFEVGRWAKRQGFACSVSTNGTLIANDFLAGLAATDMKVQVSLDGAKVATNDAIRGAGTFEKATASVARLVAANLPTTLCMVCCRENLAEIPDYFRLAGRLGAEEVRFIPLKKLGNAATGTLTPASQLEIVTAICRELDANAAYRRMCRSDLYSIIKSMLQESSRRQSCGSGIQTLLVEADGSVYPCVNTALPKFKLGHISEGKASVLARGMEFGRTLAVDSPAHPCRSCHVKRWCLAGCPGETLQRDGMLSRPHWNCEDLKQTISFVMWRLASESQTSQEKAARTSI